MNWRTYLNQASIWQPAHGVQILVVEMDPEWRYNASRWLERRAAHIEFNYSFCELQDLGQPTLHEVMGEFEGRQIETGRVFSHLEVMGEHAMDAFEAALDERSADPVGWIQTTPLYQALVAGLPTDEQELAALAERARHYPGCAGRTGGTPCRCDEVKALDALREDDRP